MAAVNRHNIALALDVREQIRDDFAALERQHVNRIEALRHESDLARQRFMEVDPQNRLVAATLEADWNKSLLVLERAIQERQQNSEIHDSLACAEQEQRLQELANDFGKVWRAAATGNDDRKRLLALTIEDATLIREIAFLYPKISRLCTKDALTPQETERLYASLAEAVDRIEAWAERHGMDALDTDAEDAAARRG